MKKLLVTGGAGFIGANFVHYWMTTFINGISMFVGPLLRQRKSALFQR